MSRKLLKLIERDVSEGVGGKIRKLVEAGADPNWSNKEGWSPLHLACYHGSLAAISTLVELGANPNAPLKAEFWPSDEGFDAGTTPLNIAELNEEAEAIAALNASG